MKNENKIVIAPNGTVTTPNVHDGLLVGLFFPPSKRALLAIKDVKGSIHCIELTGVIGLRSDAIKDGNIILDLTVQTGDAVRSEDVAHALGIEGSSAYEAHLLKTMARFKAKEILLVQLSPSYGCELTCICTGIETAPSWASALDLHIK